MVRIEEASERERDESEKGDFRQEGGAVEGVEKSTRRTRRGSCGNRYRSRDALFPNPTMKYSDEMPSRARSLPVAVARVNARLPRACPRFSVTSYAHARYLGLIMPDLLAFRNITTKSRVCVRWTCSNIDQERLSAR